MNCRTARKLISDNVNGVLAEEKKLDLDRHLEQCPECRREAAAFRAGIEAIKNPEATAVLDFTEAEWTAAIRKAVTAGAAEKPRRTAPALRPVFAYGLAVVLVGAAVLFGVRRFPWLIPAVENRPAAEPSASIGPEIIKPINPVIDPAALYASVELESSSKPTAGDVPSLTWISQETGLQIVWFVNDNLKMED